MRATLLGLAVAAAIVQAGPTGTIVFDSPAQVSGEAVATGLQALLLLLEGPAELEMAFSAGRMTNFTELYVDHRFYPAGDVAAPLVDHEPSYRDFTSPWRATLRTSGQPASLLLVSEDITVRHRDSFGQLLALQACLESMMHTDERGMLSVRAGATPCPDAIATQTRFGTGALIFEARAISIAEWHGLNVECHAEACPAGGQRQATGWGPDAQHQTTILEHSFIRYEGQGMANGTATATALALAPTAFEIRGEARLPRAEGALNCTNCTFDGNGTLRAQGRVLLQNVQPAGNRLTANIEGERFIVDEGPELGWVEPSAWAVGGALAVALFIKILAALAAKVLPENALEHPRRQSILQVIKENPGASSRRLEDLTGIKTAALRFHLLVLERSGLIVERKQARVRRYFENHGRYDASWRARTALEEPNLKALYEWLLQQGPRSQADIVAAFKAQGWARSTTEHRLTRLVASALVVKAGRTYQGLQVPPARTVSGSNQNP